jgi:hypothetical protein
VPARFSIPAFFTMSPKIRPKSPSKPASRPAARSSRELGNRQRAAERSAVVPAEEAGSVLKLGYHHHLT